MFNKKPDDIKEDKFLYIWIDILGFREDLNNPKIYDDLFKIREKFKNSFSKEEINAEAVISISDGLVLVWNLSELNPNIIQEIFNSLGKLQMNFILEQKKILRGAIAVGNVSGNLYRKFRSNKSSYSKNQEELKDLFLISNGLVKAYIMESKDIKWPIIATTEEILEEIENFLKNSLKYFGLEKINGNNHVYLYMINFLKYLDKNKRNEYEQLLLEKLQQYSKKGNDKHIFEKYHWLLKFYLKIYSNPLLKELDEFVNGVLL